MKNCGKFQLLNRVKVCWIDSAFLSEVSIAKFSLRSEDIGGGASESIKKVAPSGSQKPGFLMTNDSFQVTASIQGMRELLGAEI